LLLQMTMYSHVGDRHAHFNFKSAGDSLPKRKGTEVAEYVVQIRSLEVHTGLRKMKLDLPNAKQQPALSLQFTSRRFHPRRESDVEIILREITVKSAVPGKIPRLCFLTISVHCEDQAKSHALLLQMTMYSHVGDRQPHC
ncbi:hypothetical protein T10_8246, partial [Trichinella papuae]